MRFYIMQKPKMILFDYGNTLIFEKELNLERAYKSLYKFILKNPLKITCQEFYEKGIEIGDKIWKKALPNDLEIHQHCFFNSLFQSLGIEFNLSYVELEGIFWEALAPCMPMPNIERLLFHLNKNNIRSAVISNISFSAEALKKRINKYLPDNNFEFIIASSEFGFRKPEEMLFQAALKKASLNSNEVWYCGDNRRADIIGAASAGIKPVLFTTELGCPYHNDSDVNPDFEFLQIKDWNELAEMI
ncbi:HAD family hydrolase [Treponema pedis]|uniref:HAD superfamily hydrolase n=2 Tax=Treponema pedis TaxID=409322 RepID=S5ZWG2_9SPIR|nr:HAD family hydrolase [Treponema pedis]AGT44730.1 HAD superfamily hydrolase [Treponema pedis str. T A4]